MIGAIYTRYSTSNQTPTSTKTQVEECLSYCQKNDITPKFIFSDEETTGFNTNRKEFKNLMQTATSGLIDCVVLYDVTRGSREVVDWFSFRKLLRSLNIQVFCVTENLGDIYDPNNFITELIRIGMGEHNVLQTRQKSIASKYTLAKEGVFLGGFPPLGYDVVNKKYTINEKEAEAVRKIFDLFVKGFSYSQILKELEPLNIVGKRGSKLKKSTLYSILTNKRYTGEYSWMKEIKKELHKYVGKKNDKAIVLKDKVPQIISLDTFERAQERLRANKQKAVGRPATTEFLLSGIFYCGKCGHLMRGYTSHSSKGITTKSYRCVGKNTKSCDMRNFDAREVEEVVVKSFREWAKELNKSALVKKIINDMEKQVDSLKVSNKIEKIDAQLNNITESIKQGIFYDGLKKEVDRLKKEKAELSKMLLPIKQFSVERIEKYIADLCEQDINKQLLQKYVKAVVAQEDGQIEIFFGLNPFENDLAVFKDIQGVGRSFLWRPLYETFKNYDINKFFGKIFISRVVVAQILKRAPKTKF